MDLSHIPNEQFIRLSIARFVENGQGFMLLRNLDFSSWCSRRLDRLPESIAWEFLHGFFHGTGTESFMNATPEEKLERFFGSGEVETFLSQSGEFRINRQSPDLSLGSGTQWFENDLFVEAPDQLGSENAVEFRQDGSFQCRERESGWTEALLGTGWPRSRTEHTQEMA